MTMPVSHGELRTQLLRYAVVGGLTVAIDAGVYFGLISSSLAEPAWAKRFSFAVGAAWGFLANKLFTFDQRSFSVREPVLFILVYLLGWFLNSLIHDEVLHLAKIKWLAFLLATGVSTCTNFAGQKWIVFRAKRPPA